MKSADKDKLLDMYRRAMNRRVAVEDEMGECIKGKRPMPDKEQLADWRKRLGTPEETTIV